MPETLPEPWLRGPIAGVSPLIAPVLRSLEQAREDLAKHTAELTMEQIWARPAGLPSVGFQLRHIAGSVDRLMTYLQGQSLSEAQLAILKYEMEPGASREELLARVNEVLAEAAARIRAIDPATLADPRVVGRRELPTTVAGLIVHIAEHTQRHVGQAITTAKVSKLQSA
jgi:uncharacterized damage-inducible protein DinB